MAENGKKPFEEVSAEDAKNFFENAAKAFQNTRIKTAERKAASGASTEPDPVQKKVEDGAVGLLSSLTKIFSGEKEASSSAKPGPSAGASEPAVPSEPAKPERIYRGGKDGSVQRGESFKRTPIVVSDVSRKVEEPVPEPAAEITETPDAETPVVDVVSKSTTHAADPVQTGTLTKEAPEKKKPFVVTISEADEKREAAETETATRKVQSKRKARYLRRRQEEEAMAEFEALGKTEPAVTETVVAETTVERVEEDFDDEDAGIPLASVTAFRGISFDSGYDEEDYEGEEITFEDDELTPDEVNEYIAFNALEEALGRHAEVYGDPRKNRQNRYHDYGFGMGITFDGPSDYDTFEDDEL